jgi:hypothetical protein
VLIARVGAWLRQRERVLGTGFVIGAAMLVAGAGPAAAQSVYEDSFSGPAGARISPGVSVQWSVNQFTTAPSGRRFLGEFGNQRVALTLKGLPAHRGIKVTVQPFILRSWDGNTRQGIYGDIIGPDIWRFGYQEDTPQARPTALLTTTFANHLSSGSQAFPGSYPGGANAPLSGAVNANSLGYRFNVGGVMEPMDATYQVDASFNHTRNSVVIYFEATGLQNILDESWGIGYVNVELLGK